MSECPICLHATDAALCHRCVKYLHRKLGEVPVVLDELHTTTIRQSQTAPRNATRGSSERKLPYDERAAAAHDGLVYTLTAWHDRLVSLHQIEPHDGAEATLGQWVAKHVFRIQRDEFAEQGYEQIVGAITEGWRAVDLPEDRDRILLGLCQSCGGRVDASQGDEQAECQTCGEPMHTDDAREIIDRGMGGMYVTARQAAEMVNLRYGTGVRAKTIYDMAYRKEDPIPSIRSGGHVVFWMRVVVDELRKVGKIA